MDIAWHDKAKNHDRAADMLDRADVARGDLVVLPEMFDTGFSMDIEATNDKDGRTLTFLLELAQDLGVTIQAGRTIATCHRCLASNVATVVAPSEDGQGRVLCEYSKMHPFSLGAEHTRFAAGTTIASYPHGGFTVAPAICYDLRFPELFRACVARGADAFAIGACWPRTRAAHWRALLVARAIENQALVLGVNRVGADPDTTEKPGLRYGGGSIAVSSRGEVLGELGDEEAVLSVEMDHADVRRWRAAFPALRDRRTDAWERGEAQS